MAALASMRRSEQQNRRVQLKARISEAERAGNLEEAVRLTVELQGLERAARGGTPMTIRAADCAARSGVQ